MSSQREELPPRLSAKFTSSFAYRTMKDRIPVILSKTVDTLTRSKDKIVKKYGGESARQELKSAIGALSQLRYEVMTNKSAEPLRDSLPDVASWNVEIERQMKEGDPLLWFESSWLWMECYMYRRMVESTAMCKIITSYDIFEESKKSSFTSSLQPIATLTMYLINVIDKLHPDIEGQALDVHFKEFMQMALWGNKCDLSISAGQDNYQTADPLKQLTELKSKLLRDDTDDAFDVLRRASSGDKKARVDIVMDNAGFELLTDWCLAEYLLSSGLASSVHFHIKPMPWFVSDVTLDDFTWTLDQMCMTNHIAMSRLGNKWKSRLDDKSWVVDVDEFWSMPNDYSEMLKLKPALYHRLAKSDLIIFKGDLNYRKLTGDFNWDPTTDFTFSLREFSPAPLCALRTLKSDSVTGLSQGQAEAAAAENQDWMVIGEWAVLEYSYTRW